MYCFNNENNIKMNDSMIDIFFHYVVFKLADNRMND